MYHQFPNSCKELCILCYIDMDGPSGSRPIFKSGRKLVGALLLFFQEFLFLKVVPLFLFPEDIVYLGFKSFLGVLRGPLL